MSKIDPEMSACSLTSLGADGFNTEASLPYGCSVSDVRGAMNEFLEFLGFINMQLHSRSIPRLECFLMPANFSSIVGEFMVSAIPRHCSGLTRNRYQNGHPDLLPTGTYPDNRMLHAPEGVEVKASRYLRGWQGHNAEDVWLLVFVFEANRMKDAEEGVRAMPFRFLKVVGANLTQSDWQFSGRSAGSRRTITASVRRSGFDKMEANWIYRLSIH